MFRLHGIFAGGTLFVSHWMSKAHVDEPAAHNNIAIKGERGGVNLVLPWCCVCQRPYCQTASCKQEVHHMHRCVLGLSQGEGHAI